MSEKHGQRVHIVQKDGFRFEASFEAAPSASPVAMDEPPPLGTSSGPNAAGLLGAAVGNCLSASLLLCLQKSRATVAGITTDVTVHVERNEKGRLRVASIDIDIAPNLGADDAGRLERCSQLFEEFCTVGASVRQGIPLNVRVVPAG